MRGKVILNLSYRILRAMSRRVLGGIVLSRSAHGDEVQRFRSLSELREVVIWGTFAVLERIWRRVTFAVLWPKCARKCFRRVIPTFAVLSPKPGHFRILAPGKPKTGSLCGALWGVALAAAWGGPRRAVSGPRQKQGKYKT